MTNTTDYNAQVDNARITAAHATHAALIKAAVDAGAALAQAETEAKAASDAAQSAADAGGDLEAVMLLEVAAETANRKLASARRMQAGAVKRRDEGLLQRDSEVKQAHGAAMNAAMRRFVAVREEALAALLKLESLKKEHASICGDMRVMANAAKSGLPNIVEARPMLTDANGNVMDNAEFSNRMSQREHHEWDSGAGKLRWTEV
jgi:hypothetical protein